MGSIVLASIASILFLLPTATVHASEEGRASEPVRLLLDHPEVEHLRLELWDAAGESIYDSGLVAGRQLVLGELSADGGLRYELRAWDAAGDLVLSQVSTLAGAAVGGALIYSIGFDTVPAGTQIVGGGEPITLEGDVTVTNDLSVNGNATVSNILDAFAIDVGQLRDPSGGPFFGSCNSGSSIRTIFPNGAVTCEPDDVGDGGGADNLGNHQATQNIVFRDAQEGLVGSSGAKLQTGGLGGTFFAQPGNSSSDRFGVKDVNGVRSLVVNPEGYVLLSGFTPGGTAVDDLIDLGSDGNAFMQLRGSGTPYIDFSNDLASDFDMRILLSGDNSLTFDGGRLGVGGMMTNPQFKIDLPNLSNQDGQGRANAWMTYVAAQFKQNVEPLAEALDTVMKLRGVGFDWHESVGGGSSLGFIGEEVAAVLPQVVSRDEDGVANALNVDGVVPVLVEAIKQQQALIDGLEERLLELESARE